MDEITSSPAPDESRPTSGGESTGPHRDRTTRGAALAATLVALPVTAAVAGFTFAKLAPDEPAAAPSAAASAVRPQSTTPVEMPAPALAERPATVCRALVSQLPASVRDLHQRPVTAGVEQNAAYGDPALTVACGGTPPTFPATDDVWTINKVCWHAVREANATVLTTVDRETPIRVRVPRQYEQPLQWITPISDAVTASVPSANSAPPGCTT